MDVLSVSGSFVEGIVLPGVVLSDSDGGIEVSSVGFSVSFFVVDSTAVVPGLVSVLEAGAWELLPPQSFLFVAQGWLHTVLSGSHTVPAPHWKSYFILLWHL